MSANDLLQYGLWLGVPAVQGLLLYWMAQRKLHRQYPFFFSYTILQIISSMALLFIHWNGTYATYFYSYWTSSLLIAFAEFAVMYELFCEAFKPYGALRNMGAVIFRWAGLVLVLTATLIAASSNGAAMTQVLAGVLTLERGVRVVECGFVLLLLLFAGHLGLTWRNRVVGIALGFGLFSAVELTVLTLRYQMGPEFGSGQFLSLLKSFAYAGAAILWTTYSLMKQPAPRAVGIQTQADRWNFALIGLQPAPNDAFMPNLEKTVDRILSREGNGHGNGNGHNGADHK